jgi:LysR family nitrogen assimilation transcriptional regulator
MDVRTLRYFQTVAECGSYSRGSELLRISQPAVSRAIRALEQELGRPVFKRHSHGVTLTEAGQILFERSQVLLRQLEQTKAEIRNRETGPSGVIAIALPPAAGQYLACALMERFAREYPNVFLKIVGGFSGYIHEWLVRGRVDLACLHDPLPQRGFNIVPIMDEEVFLVGKPGTFPMRAQRIRTEDLASLPLILPSRPNASRRLLDNWTAAKGMTIAAKIEVDDHTITRALLRRGIGFSLLTHGAIESDLRRGDIEARALDPSAFWQLSLVTAQHAPQLDIHIALIRVLREAARDLVESGAWPGRIISS